MDKEKTLQLLSEAMDKGASISVHLPQFRSDEGWRAVTLAEASDYINRFNELVNSEIDHHVNEKINVETLVIDNDKMRVAVSYIPSKDEVIQSLNKKIEILNQKVVYLQEDVDLSGGDKIA